MRRFERGHRRLHQTRGKRTHHHDDERGTADQRTGAAAFQDRPADDRNQRRHDADDAEDIHGLVRLQPLREACAQPHQRLTMNLADTGFGYFEHLADFAQVHVFVVIQ
jgi:hypothetical protein